MELYSPDLVKMHDIHHDSIQHLVTVGNSLLDFIEYSIDVEVNGTSSEVSVTTVIKNIFKHIQMCSNML